MASCCSTVGSTLLDMFDKNLSRMENLAELTLHRKSMFQDSGVNFMSINFLL